MRPGGALQVYKTPEELWREIAASRKRKAEAVEAGGSGNGEAVDVEQEDQQQGDAQANGFRWYTGAVEYWDNQEASDNGVLGGFGHVSPADITDSRAFLKKASPRAGLPGSLPAFSERLPIGSTTQASCGLGSRHAV